MNQSQLIETPQPKSVGAITEASRAQAEIQAALVMARGNPRDEQNSIDAIARSCQRLSLAAKSEYRFSRGGSDIVGPSVHLLRVIACAWGNLQFGTRILNRAEDHTDCEAYAWDVQSNTKKTIPFSVRHVRETRSGDRPLTGDRDIYELVANFGARRERSCLEAVIPKDVVEDAQLQCLKTISAEKKFQVTPANLKAMLKQLKSIGVSRADVERKFQRKLESISPMQMVMIKEAMDSIEAGLGVVQDYFPAEPEPEAGGVESLEKELLPSSEPESASDEPASEPLTPYKRWRKTIMSEGDPEVLLEYAVTIDDSTDVTAEEKKVLGDLITRCREELSSDDAS